MRAIPSHLISSIIVTVRVISLSLLLTTPSIAFTPKAQVDQRDIRIGKQTITELPAKAKRYALVIGVDEYQDREINRLEGASNDAKALASALIQYAGFPSDQVVLLTSDQPLDHQPTRANVLRRLSNLRQAVQKDGLLLVSFAGHGIERNGQAYLLPMDAQVSGDIALLEDSAINVETMRERIRQTEVKQVIIILDACRNNPESGRGDSGNPLTDAYIHGFNFDVQNRGVTAFATLYATGVGQVAHEYKEKRQGYFTWALVEALKGAAANDKGEVTLSRLVRYVQEQVPRRITIDLGSDKQQNPLAVIEGYKADDLVISITIRIPLVANTNTTEATHTLDKAAIELSFWDTIKNSTNLADYKAYLQRYPNGQFVELAKNQITSLETPINNPSVSNKIESENAFDFKGFVILIAYREKDGVNRLEDATRIANRLKSYGADVKVNKFNEKSFNGKLLYHDDLRDIAIQIARSIKDIVILKPEETPIGKHNEFLICLQ
jgi:Caspase domain